MKKILIFTTKFGHKSLAEAIEEVFKKSGWEVDVFNHHFNNGFLFYNFSYIFFPSMYQTVFNLTNKSKTRKLFEKYGKFIKAGEIEERIKTFQPDVVFSTFCFYNYKIEELKNKYNFKFINLVTDPRTFSLMNLSKKAEKNLVYDQKTKKDAINYLKGQPEKVQTIGWPVRERFFLKEKNLSQKKDRLTILLCGGSLGTNAILKFLPLFLNLEKNLKLIIVTGENKLLYKTVRLFKEITRSQQLLNKNSVEIKILRFTKEIDRLMAKSDLVAGKAGPNLLFESVAAGKPFLALTHIHGQETGNLEIIKQKGLGWVAETPKEAKVVLEKIVSDPKFLESKNKSILKERSINILAVKKIVQLANQLIG